MPLISGTMLIYTDRCSRTLKKFVFFKEKKVPKIMENIEKRMKAMKKCQTVVCVFLGNLSSTI